MHLIDFRLKYAGARKPAGITSTTFLIAASVFAAAGLARAQDTFKPPPPVTYTERYEVYGGINFANGKAGQSLPKDFDMGGGEVMGTYWLKPKYGVLADVRYDAGTTPVLPGAQATNPEVQTRPLVSQFSFQGGGQYHWVGNQLAGINLHAMAGGTSGQYDHSNPSLPANVFFPATGLYTNRTGFTAAFGGSLDFNRSARLAIRLAPDFVLEHQGTDLRKFVYVSAGIVYRVGKR